jgi:rare lipoprotein A
MSGGPGAAGVARLAWVGGLVLLCGLWLAWVPPASAGQPTKEGAVQVQRGAATYYARKFHGRRTASGERLDQNANVAAHPSLPFGTVVRVTNLRNGRAVDVRVVDRGPARGPQRRGVIIDLTQSAARELGFMRQGRTPVHLEVLEADELQS